MPKVPSSYSLSIVVLFLCRQLRVPATVGFILTGILAGPHLLGLVKAVHEVEMLAEIGVILLLFTIGVEFSFANLLRCVLRTIPKGHGVPGPTEANLGLRRKRGVPKLELGNEKKTREGE